VGFALTYAQDGRPGISNPAGFNDLGDVPYTRCTPSPS
jgi:hypothetical protein